MTVTVGVSSTRDGVLLHRHDAAPVEILVSGMEGSGFF